MADFLEPQVASVPCVYFSNLVRKFFFPSAEMASEISTRHVEKLDGTNFLTWKFEVQAVFVAAGVDEIVNGTRTLAEDATAEVRTAWKKKNAKVMVLILTSIERAQLQPLVTCTTAKEMWDALCAIHEQ